MSRISNRQLVIAFLACRLSAEMTTIPGEMFRYGTDRFIVILLAKLVVALLYLPVIAVTLKFRGDSVITATMRRNKAFGITAGVIMSVLLTMTAVQTVLSLQHYVTDTLLNNIVTVSGIAGITAAAVYGAAKGLSAVTRSSVFAAVIFGLLIFLIGVTMWDKTEPDHLYFSLANDRTYFFKSLISEISMNSEILIFAVITDELRRKPHRTVLYYLPILLILLELLNLLYNLILGPYMSKVEYPLYIIASLSDIVLFQRLDGIDAIVWLMCGIIKTALLIYCIGRIYAVCSKKPRTKLALTVTGFLVFMLCIILGSDAGIYDRMTDVMNSGIHILLGGVVVPLIVLAAGRKKQSRRVKKNDENI
ncbi:MAG: GerAB/ArcD/ProY family transporter [Ruminiclostridium sp.]|nr:GerAB/ArcD/ProY family transporter [Ruminiclostridium sp.]